MKGGVYPNKGPGAPWVVQYPGIFRRFKTKEDAENFLIALNYKDAYEGGIDLRDYRKDAPLGFETLTKKWLEVKESEGVRSLKNPRNHIHHATTYLGNRNVKEINYGVLEDLFRELRRTTDLSSKSLYDIKTTLRTFFRWLSRREGIPMPEFPEIKYEMAWRKTIDIETQGRILAEIRRIADNPKVPLGIEWLATYISIRPIELIHVKEGDIDLLNGLLTITHNKVQGQYRRVYLLEEDVEAIKALPRGFPQMYFFRHEKGKKGQTAGKRFGKDYFYQWWRKACANLGIKGVDLYGGTRHSTVTALDGVLTPEQIMEGTDHRTNKAFARYFQGKANQRRDVAKIVRGMRADWELIGKSKQGTDDNPPK